MIRTIATHLITWTMGLALFTGCASDRAVISQANQFHENIDEAVIQDEVLNDYIQAVGNRISSSHKEEPIKSWSSYDGLPRARDAGMK